MAAFALVFVPTMIAYQWGSSWRQSMLIAILVSLAAYVIAFEIALVEDQPFGPVLVLSLVVVVAIAWSAKKLMPGRTRPVSERS